jgi:2-phosphoglycerate kinase
MANKHFIYGVPGVGKSTLAAGYAKRNDLLYLELDSLRPKAQSLARKEEEPFIFEYTTEAWKKFGQLNEENAIKGFLAVRAAFQKYIAQELTLHGEGFVAEATYIDPRYALEDSSIVTLLITSDERLHYSHFFVNRPRSHEEDGQFKAARWIQNFLIDEADKLGVPILDNSRLDTAAPDYKR